MSKCLALKRRKHGLTKNNRAMIVCDRAPCHMHKSYHVLRQNWALLENCEFFGDDFNAEVEVPVGIGGCGAPNNAFHQFVHMPRRFSEREQIGHTENLAMRNSFYDVGCTINGCTR